MPAAREFLLKLDRAPELIRAVRETREATDLVRRYLGSRPRRYPFRLPLRSGGQLTLASTAEVTVFWQIFVHRCYTLPAECETVLDCGANVGIFALWTARQRPKARVIAVEPFPDTFRRLAEHVRVNDLGDRIECAQLGLAAASGKRRMPIDGDSPTRKLTLPDEQAAAGTIAVRCLTLADCLRQFRLESVDLLKMDIEGSEWEVLLSTPPEVFGRIRHIQLEYHEVHRRFNYTTDRLFAHLAAGGHRLVSRTEDAHQTGMASFVSATPAGRGFPRGSRVGPRAVRKSAAAAP